MAFTSDFWAAFVIVTISQELLHRPIVLFKSDKPLATDAPKVRL